MKQTKARKSAPSPQSVTSLDQKQTGPSPSPTKVFMNMALDMSWRLAIVILIPVIGGFKLDELLHTAPILTIVGFLVAMGGMAFVLKRTLQEANSVTTNKDK